MREHTANMWGKPVKIRGKYGARSHALFLGFFIAALAWNTPDAAAATITGAACAIDGDSLLIGGVMVGDICKGGDIEIRLQGIDAMEWNQTCGKKRGKWNCGRAATDAMRAMIKGREVTCTPVGRDRYRRTLATCTVAGQDIQRRMVLAGWAIAYRKYSKKYIADEMAAKKARRGIWAGAFISPSQWRRRKKKRKLQQSR